MSCNLCDEPIDPSGAPLCCTSCCNMLTHTLCYTENLMAQRYNPTILCGCGEAIWHSPYASDHVATPAQPLPTTNEFKEAMKACKQTVFAMRSAKREMNKLITEKSTEFKGLVQPHAEAIRTIKACINTQLRTSPAMKAYRSSCAKSTFAISKLSKDFDVNYMAVNRAVGGCRRSDWRQNPATRMRRFIRVRI
jgi:hypothetical protein